MQECMMHSLCVCVCVCVYTCKYWPAVLRTGVLGGALRVGGQQLQ